MTLGELIQEYRNSKGLSQRQFAMRCALSNGYIAMLERGGINPKTNQPITPTLVALKKIADGMNLSLTELLNKADDMQVSLQDEDSSFDFQAELSPFEQQLIENYRQLNEEGQEKLLDHSIDLVSSGRYIKSDKSALVKKA